MDLFTRLLIGSVALASVVFQSDASAENRYVMVSLKNSVMLSGDGVITVGDIADVSGGVPIQRQRITSLDLETRPSDGSDCFISRRQVELRLILAGFDRDLVRFQGPKQLTIRGSHDHQFQIKLEQTLNGEIARQFGLEPSKVNIQILDPRQLDQLQQKLGGEPFETSVVVQPQLPIGPTKMQIALTTENGSRIVTTLSTKVVINMKVALTRHSIERGTVLRADMFEWIDRPIVKRNDYASPDELVGRQAKQRIPSNDVILASDLSVPTTRKTFDVKQNELLDVVILVNGGQIRLKNAKALASANRGETIAVQNTLSNRRFNAKVIGEHLAEVQMFAGARR